MRIVKRILDTLINKHQNKNFLVFLDKVEDFFAKILALIMIAVVSFAILDLMFFLGQSLLHSPNDGFSKTLLKIFGLFLNVLIALEIMQNITSYLSSHIIQIEMVVITSLIAVARKIIILDFEKISHLELLALAAAIFALSICYWLVRRTNNKYPHH